MSQAIHSIQRPGLQKGEFPPSIFFRPAEARHSSHASFEEVSFVFSSSLQAGPVTGPCAVWSAVAHFVIRAFSTTFAGEAPPELTQTVRNHPPL
jgi:hypothetical protein